jgi:transposase
VLACLHHSHHVGFERLARLAREMFGLSISEGAIANALHRLETPLEAERDAIRAKLRAAAVVWSDETTTRIDGKLHWHWVFVTRDAVLHEIAPRRAKAVAQAVMGDHKPAVWISDRYAGQQDMAMAHQVCLAHVLRDVQYAIANALHRGDAVFAPALAKLLSWAIAVGRRRDDLKDSTLQQYRAKADRALDRLLATPAPHPAGRTLQAQVKAWRTKFFVFLEDRRVSATNNVAEREIRPSVVFRKVTGGFRSQWGPAVHAGYRSVTSTARLAGQTAYSAIRGIAETLFRPAAHNA